MEFLTIGIISYLMGSIPFGFILTKIFLKKDIREIGSGNIGATNALRTGNKLIGYSTLLLDVIKAILPVLYIKINHTELIYISSRCVFLGFIFCVSWLLIFLVSKYSSLSSLIGSLTIPVYIFFNDQISNALFFGIMFVLIFYTHRENIKRLKNKEESKTKIY